MMFKIFKNWISEASLKKPILDNEWIYPKDGLPSCTKEVMVIEKILGFYGKITYKLSSTSFNPEKGWKTYEEIYAWKYPDPFLSDLLNKK